MALAPFTASNLYVKNFHKRYVEEEKIKPTYKCSLMPTLICITEAYRKDLILVFIGLGEKTVNYIAKTFPQLELHCYHTFGRDFDKVKFLGRFDDEVAISYLGKRILLIINSAIPKKRNRGDLLTYFKSNTEEIKRWVVLSQPSYCLVKFWLPYPGEKLEKVNFLDGQLLAMPYHNGPVCYLVVNGKTKIWNLKEFDERMAYHCQITRKEHFLSSSGERVSYDQAYCDYVLNRLNTLVSQQNPNVNVIVLQNENNYDKEYGSYASEIKTAC